MIAVIGDNNNNILLQKIQHNYIENCNLLPKEVTNQSQYSKFLNGDQKHICEQMRLLDSDLAMSVISASVGVSKNMKSSMEGESTNKTSNE